MKRLFDVVVGGSALLVLLPILIIVAIAVRLRIGAPIFFTQQRPGLNSRPFRLTKFRTMVNASDAEGLLLPDAMRLPPFGAWLRRTSLDELPELWNVVRGDMSLVGPRPLLMDYLPLYSPENRRRHEVRPGLTGWAQVNGRNSISWDEKFRLDVWYVDNRSFWLDLKILVMTIALVIRRVGITADGDVTMPRFEGHRQP